MDVKPTIHQASASASSSAPSYGADAKPPVYYTAPPNQIERLAYGPKDHDPGIWALKVPRFLWEQWGTIRDGGVELGELVIDANYDPPRISLKLPTGDTGGSGANGHVNGQAGQAPRIDASNTLSEYKVDITKDADGSQNAKNTFVFMEKERVWAGVGQAAGGSNVGAGGLIGKRKREKAEPRLLGKISHNANVTPILNAKYHEILRRRKLEEGQSKKPIVRMEDTGIDMGMQNQLAAGYANTQSSIGRGMIALEKSRQTGDKRARLERTELTDRLISLFKSKPFWSIMGLREETKQPDAWLREVLQTISERVQGGGPYDGMWKLKREFEELDKIGDDEGEEDDEEEEEEEEDEDEMEEVGL